MKELYVSSLHLSKFRLYYEDIFIEIVQPTEERTKQFRLNRSNFIKHDYAQNYIIILFVLNKCLILIFEIDEAFIGGRLT